MFKSLIDDEYNVYQVISLGALQTVMKREVEKMLDNVVIPHPNSKIYPQVRQRPDSEKLRILVTGGAGFVGSHLVDRLAIFFNDAIVIQNVLKADDGRSFCNRVGQLFHWFS